MIKAFKRGHGPAKVGICAPGRVTCIGLCHVLATGLDCQIQRRRNSSCSGLGLRAWGACGPVPGQCRDMESPPKQVTSTYSDAYSNLERQAPSIAHKTFKKLNPAYLRHKAGFEGDY